MTNENMSVSTGERKEQDTPALSVRISAGAEASEINTSASASALSGHAFSTLYQYEVEEEAVRKAVEEEWAHVGINNAFAFARVMTANKKLLLELIQNGLPEKHIVSIEDVRSEVEIRISGDAHGVRLDITARDDQNRLIDVEMQMKDEKNIPRRTRFYQSGIDQTLLEKGMDYNNLVDTVIMFITPFDPFGKRFYRYTFRNLCVEDAEIEFGDGTTKVVLNADGEKGNISEDLRGFLKLVAGDDAPAPDTFAWRVQNQVILARKNARWREQYMNWNITLMNERHKGESLQVIRMILKKHALGQSPDNIAEDLLEEPDYVRKVCGYAEANRDVTPKEVLKMLEDEEKKAGA